MPSPQEAPGSADASPDDARQRGEIPVRSAVKHVFARQKGPMGLVVRTIGIARATTKIGLASLVYNLQRLVWLSARATPE